MKLKMQSEFELNEVKGEIEIKEEKLQKLSTCYAVKNCKSVICCRVMCGIILFPFAVIIDIYAIIFA
jgi:hypothetical protein